MKVLKVFAVLVGVLVALGAIVLVLALTPAVQSWAVHKAVADIPGMKLEFSHVAAGFSSARVDDVRLVKDGMVVTAKQVSAKYSAWDYLTHRRISVDDLSVEALVLDLRATAHPAPATGADSSGAPTATAAHPNARASATPAPPEPFRGLLNQAQLPFDVRVARFTIPGKVLLPDEQTAEFELHGSDIATAQKGTIDWKADVTNTQPNSPWRALHATGSANLHITTEHRIDLADASTVTNVEGANLPSDQLKFDVKAEQPAAGGNEGYNATLSLVRGQTTTPLLNVVGQYNATAGEISGAWTVTIRTEQLAALLHGLGLPEVAAEGSGRFSVKPDSSTVSASGELRSDVSHLEKISPDLTAIGRLRLLVRFDGGIAERVASLQQFVVDATAADGRKLAEITTLQRIGYALADQRVTFADAKAELARVKIDALPLAWAQPFLKGLTIVSGDISLALSVTAEADGSHVRVTTVDPLQVRNATLRQGQKVLADRLTLSAAPKADYAADDLKAELNDLKASTASGDTVSGRFTAHVTHLGKSPHVAFTTDTQAKFVAALKPYLPLDTGPLTVATKAEGTFIGQTLRFQSSVTTLARPDGASVATLSLQQPLTFNLQDNVFTAEKPGAEALRIKLGDIPLAWAEPFVAGAKLSGHVTGGTIGVTVRTLDDLTAAATEPIAMRGIALAMNNQPMLQNIDLEADFTAAKHGNAIHFEVRRVEAKQATATLLSLSTTGDVKIGDPAKGTKTTIIARGAINGDLGLLAQQPVAASSSSLARGTLTGNFDANIADTIQAKASFAARNLVAKQDNQALGDAALDLTATVQPDGSSVLRIPFTLANANRKSDLLVDGKVTRTATAISFDGRITSELLVIDDLKPLAALAPASKSGTTSTPPARTDAPATPPATAAPAAPRGTPGPVTSIPASPAASDHDTVPFWNGFGGKVDLDLKQIKYGQNYTVSDVKGSTTINGARLALNSLEGKINDKPFKLAAGIDFAVTQPKPYTLAATVDVTEFDVGAFLRAANPNEAPTVETKVAMKSKLDGNGGTLADLAQHTYGVFDVTGSRGVLRLLTGAKAKVANLGSLAAGLYGAVKGSDTSSAIGEVTQKLANLPFERVTMHVERGADLNLNISRIEFLSADTRVIGSGGIMNQPGVAIQDQPLQLTFQLGAKEGMAVLLDRVKMLNGKQDEQGYALMSRTFTIKGTASHTDRSDLEKFLTEIGTNTVLPAAAGALQKLFGR